MSGNPFGVVIPPDKGDENWADLLDRARSALTVARGVVRDARYRIAVERDGRLTPQELIAKLDVYEAWRQTPDAPATPHTPASAPNTPPRAPEAPPTRSDPHRSNP